MTPRRPNATSAHIPSTCGTTPITRTPGTCAANPSSPIAFFLRPYPTPRLTWCPRAASSSMTESKHRRYSGDSIRKRIFMRRKIPRSSLSESDAALDLGDERGAPLRATVPRLLAFAQGLAVALLPGCGGETLVPLALFRRTGRLGEADFFCACRGPLGLAARLVELAA